MTKQQRSGTGLSPSRICRLLLGLLGLKLLALAFLFFGPFMPEAGDMRFPALASGIFGAGSPAEAAMTGAPGAPPAVEPSLPGGNAPSVQASNFVRGRSEVNAPVNRGAAASVLPLIESQPAPSRSANATADGAPLSLERDSLARRQESLARKEQELRVLEGELSKKLEEMHMLENRISRMMKDAEGQQDARYRHLVDVLSNMKAKQAATVLETLDPKIAVKVLAGMRGRQAGEILSFVKPERAAQLTESLARMQMPLL